MRRILILFLSLALLAGACGSDSDVSAGADSTSVEEQSSAENSADESAVTTTEAPVEEPETTGAEVAAPLEQIRILHPETLGFAAPFTMMDLDGPLSEVSAEVVIDTWASPDVMRSAIVNEDVELTAVPSYVGANLYNKDVDIQLLAVVVWGLLWMIAPEGTEPSWESLRGQTIMMPFPNDMPDLVFQYLAAANGLVVGEDFEIEYYAQPPEVVGRLVSGTGKWAVLPEHVATMALAKSNENGQALTRMFDLQAEWANAAGTSPRIPQAGVVVPGWLARERPDVTAAMLDQLEAAADLVDGASPETVAALSQASGLPAPMVEQVIPRLNIEIVPGGEAKEELEKFFTELASLSPDIIGGKLPDEGFYLDDPR